MSGSADVGAALQAATRWLDEIPGVIAVGEGENHGAPTIDVWISGHPDAANRLPTHLHGIPVRIQDTGGPVHAQRPRP